VASCERDGPRSSSAATELHIVVVVVVVELFLTVFLGLVVEEVEEAKGHQLRLRSLTRTFKLGLIGLSLAAVSQRSQPIILSTIKERKRRRGPRHETTQTAQRDEARTRHRAEGDTRQEGRPR
jgi:hypothetical protein